ncbi:O-antigen ligase family protein [Vibrio cyclitrophicus]
MIKFSDFRSRVFPVCFVLLFFFCSPGIDRFGQPNALFLALFSIVSLLFFLSHYRTINLHLELSLLELFYLFFSSVVLIFIVPSSTIPNGFFLSYLNIVCSIIIGVFVFNYVVSLNLSQKERVLVNTILLVSLFSIIHFFMLKLGVITPSERDFYRNYTGGFVILKGFFNEPAHYGIFMSVLIFTGLVAIESFIRKHVVLVVLACTSVFLTYSLSGIVMCLSAFGIWYFKNYKTYLVTIILPFVFFAIAALFAVSFTLSFSSESIIFDRLINVLAGDDNSSNYRIFESWAFVQYIDNPFNFLFGTGVGNNDYFSEKVMKMDSSFVGINVLANSLYIGGFIYLSFVLFKFWLLCRSPYVFSFTVIFCFSHGYLVGPIFYPLLGFSFGFFARDNYV